MAYSNTVIKFYSVLCTCMDSLSDLKMGRHYVQEFPPCKHPSPNVQYIY